MKGKLKGAAAQSTGIPESLVDAFERLSSALLSEDGLSDTAKGALKDIQRTIAGKSVDEVLKNPIQGALELADELGKEPPIFDVSDPALRIPSKTSELLQNVLVHVFRNSVDHGLESGTERSEAGKDPTGRITVEAQSDDTTLTISVWDDGRGLDLQRLRNKYAELHGDEAAQNATTDAVAELIFDSGMSTAQELTDISGRGVGMDAVRSFVSAEGGSVSLALDAQEPSQGLLPVQASKLEIPISFQV